MDRVAAEARVAKQTLYSHFGSKEGLLRAMFDRYKQQSLGGLDPAGDMAAELAVFGEQMLRRIFDPEILGVQRLMIAQAAAFPDLARLFYEAGQIVIVSAISPLRADRARARALIPAPHFIEVHCRCPLAVCEARDPKGLYRKARAGLLLEFTGISSPYEEPDAPELVVDSATTSVEDEVARVVDALARRGLLDPRG